MLINFNGTDYDQQIVNRFSQLQDMAVGYCDVDEMTNDVFITTYPNKKALLKEVKYWLDMYYGTGDGIGCITSEERYDPNPKVRQNWRNEVARLKRFITKLEK